LFGTDKAAIGIETIDQDIGAISIWSPKIYWDDVFYDPPNGEIIEQFRQIEGTTERCMVAVHKIRFPEEALPRSEAVTN
jgi:hypothetical protein